MEELGQRVAQRDVGERGAHHLVACQGRSPGRMSDEARRALRWVAILLAAAVGLLQGAAAIADGSLGWTQTISNGAIGTVGAGFPANRWVTGTLVGCVGTA